MSARNLSRPNTNSFLTSMESGFVEASSSSSEKKTVIFLHLPKTAGTTLRYIIQWQYRPDKTYELYRSGYFANLSHAQMLERFRSVFQNRSSAIGIVNSHLGFGLHEYIKRPCVYITYLRNPVDRVISLYKYYQRHRHLSYNDFNRFIESHSSARNGMTRSLSGCLLTDQLSASNEREVQEKGKAFQATEMLEVAKHNLQERFVVVGLMENFDESLMLLKRKLGWEIPLYYKNNVGTNSLDRLKSLPPATLEAIVKNNEADLQLYEYAKSIFNDTVARQDDSFFREIKEFRERNMQNANKLYFILRQYYNRMANRVYKKTSPLYR